MDCKIVRLILIVFREPVSTPRHLLKSFDQALAPEAGQPLDPEQAVELIDFMLAYNGVSLQTKLEYGAVYLALAALLAIMTYDVHEMLSTVGWVCAGRPARSRWCKSTAMKE
jgi:hypothetical protein